MDSGVAAGLKFWVIAFSLTFLFLKNGTDNHQS